MYKVFDPSVYLDVLWPKSDSQETLSKQTRCWFENSTPTYSLHVSCRLLVSPQGSFFSHPLLLVSACICPASALTLEALWDTSFSQWTSIGHLATNTMWTHFSMCNTKIQKKIKNQSIHIWNLAYNTRLVLLVCDLAQILEAWVVYIVLTTRPC